MEDLKKIQEFFSKPLNEATFKVGDKVTYLGHPGVITAVRKTSLGDTTYSVAYDKGFGRTKVSDIFNKGGEIKLAEAKKEAALMLDRYEVDFVHPHQPGANVYANIEIPSENPTFEDDIQIKGQGKTEEEAFKDLKRNYENYKKTGIYETKEKETLVKKVMERLRKS